MNDEDYREVQIGPRKMKIPKDWKKTKIGELAGYQNGYGFSSSDWEDKGLPIIRIQNLTDSAGEETNHYQGELEDKYIVKDGDLLVSWSATLGVFKWDGPKAALNQHIFKVNPKEKVDKDFLYYLLDQNLDLLERKIHGTTMKHITKGTFENTFIALPPLPEQRNIAEILSTVDEAIQQTDDVIETARELKKGLMQDLLTKGIRHDDFKRVRIGPKKIKLPTSWKIERIDKIFDIKAGGDSKDKECSDSRTEKHQYPVFANSLEDKGLYGYSKDFEYPGGCVTITGRGDLGHAEYRDKKFSAIVRLLVLIPQEEVDGEFVKYYINGEVFFPSESTGVPQLTRPEVAKTKIALPPLNEQKEIAEKLSVVDEKIRQEEKYKEKLEELKKGLMQDLLTGKVRVNNLVN